MKSTKRETGFGIITGRIRIEDLDAYQKARENSVFPACYCSGSKSNRSRRRRFPSDHATVNFSRTEAAAQAVGLAQGALEKSIKYAKRGTAFEQAIADFQGNQLKIAEIGTMMEAARALYYKAAALMDRGKVDHNLIAMAKLFAGPVGIKAADEAVQIYGGYGYIAEYDVERYYRYAKIIEIYEATKEIEEVTIARRMLAQY